MAGKTVGIEIGNDTVKMALVSGGRLTGMAVERMPDNMVSDGRIASPDAMINFLKDMRRAHHIPKCSAALVLPYHSVITNVVSVPPMSDKELSINLPFEFRDYVGQEAGGYHYDYCVMDTVRNLAGQVEKLDIFGAAVKKDLMESYYDMMKKAGFTLKLAIPHEAAWMNLARRASDEGEEVAIVDMGHTATRIYIFSDGKFIMGREIELGGQLLDASIARQQRVDAHVARSYKENNTGGILSSEDSTDAFNTIAVEIMKVVNFYSNFSNRNSNLKDIYLAGGMASIENLRLAIRRATGLNAHHIFHLVPGGAEDGNTLCCALAAGAGVQ